MSLPPRWVLAEMVKLLVAEETDELLVLTTGALAMLFHMSVSTLVAAVVSMSLTLFLLRYIGFLAIVFVALPGAVIVICGFLGCANARKFTFTFDKVRGEFAAQAGGVRLTRSLADIRLVHIERETGGAGGLFGGEAPSFSPALLLSDSQRLRLEGGISATGSGRGPQHLQDMADKIRLFLALPQTNVPLLVLSRASKEEEQNNAAEIAQAESGLVRWLACQGIVPRFEPPLSRYEWMEPPEGPVRLHGLPGSLRLSGAQGGMGDRWARPGQAIDPGLGPVVVGRPQQQPTVRTMQIVVPEGTLGQAVTVVTPDGAQVTVTIPSDMQVGETMVVQY